MTIVSARAAVPGPVDDPDSVDGSSDRRDSHDAAAAILKRYRAVRARRDSWERHWQDCYDVTLPSRGDFSAQAEPGAARTRHIFDGTAPDAVEQLAASLLANLTPPWSNWFAITPGPDLGEADRQALGPALDRATEVIQAHFDRSNLAVEIHQCFLDLVIAGTACLMVEEAPIGETAAVRFTAVPLARAVLEEGPDGRLTGTWRQARMTADEIVHRFPRATIPDQWQEAGRDGEPRRLSVVEAVVPKASGLAPQTVESGFDHWIIADDGDGDPHVLRHTSLGESPFINFRWIKAPGEEYGRSPVMKALPDIKTANKVVELSLKNASIAVTGIWQADDDGILNPSNIKLVPGTVIPKAVGSAGLKPLEMPGRFDVSQLVLDDMRSRIRHALLSDTLSRIEDRQMTATEVMQRSAEVARLTGAIYGRLRTELLVPLVLKTVSILRRRGEIAEFAIDGHTVTLTDRSPLARLQAQADVDTTLSWLETAMAMGPSGHEVVDSRALLTWLARKLGVPEQVIAPEPPPEPPPEPMTDAPGSESMPVDPVAIDPVEPSDPVLTAARPGGRAS